MMYRLLLSIFIVLFVSTSYAGKHELDFSKLSTTQSNGKVYYELGDMLIPQQQSLNKFDTSKNKWTDGIVYYSFASDVTEENRLRFIDAANVWKSIADVQFVERTDQSNYLQIINDNRNYAVVGMVGGAQTLAMNNWSSKYIIVHEIGHSLGMWHEQQRSDRDDHISILFDNIKDDQRYNFYTHTTSNIADYDFMSVMHYSLSAYSKNGEPTMQPKQAGLAEASVAGHNQFISGGDQLEVATYYGAVNLTIPDAAFKQYLVDQFDVNNDGEIDSIEAAQVTRIQTPGNGTISSLEGIQHFRYLTDLNVANENLSTLPELPSRIVTLDVSNNQFESLNESWSFAPLITNLTATGNPLDPYTCDAILFIQNELTGLFSYNPLQDGSQLTCDNNAQYVLIDGKPRTNLRSKSATTYFIDVPAGQSLLTFNTSMTDNLLGGEMDAYVSFNTSPSISQHEYASTNSGNIESITIENPEQGRWYITLSPIDRSYENVDLVATLEQNQQDDALLLNGDTRSNLTAQQGDTLSFYMDVPENASQLSFNMSGGTGDADLYVKLASQPTVSSYDCRPYKNGNTESCLFESPQAGRYFVSIKGYSDFSAVTLNAQYTESTPPKGGKSVLEALSGSAAEWRYYQLDLPAGMTSLNVTLAGGTGDADLYVAKGYQPNSANYDCRPYKNGNNEACVFSQPASDVWVIALYGYSQYNNTNLTIEWQ